MIIMERSIIGMLNNKKISISKWWMRIVNDDIYGLLMKWASAITAIMLVITTLIVIIKGVMCVCSKKK
jgi:hypothetical protein